VATLPSRDVVLPLLERAIHRCEQGQLHTHRAARDGTDSLRRWAEGLGEPPAYRWWEAAAGASSSVAAHALIAAAAHPEVSAETAAAIDAAYNPSIGALTVFLDDLVDREADRTAGEHNYLAYYEDSEEAAERLAWVAEEAGNRIDSLPRASRHRAILAGVGAFYLSEPAAATPYAQPIKRRLLAALGPGTRALSAFMRLRG
jgi:tetraprenyl-beta-curcumene synthase